MNKIKTLLLSFALLISASSFAQNSTKEIAKSKMSELEKLIKVANKKGINTLKEQTALRTAEIFMDYADYDEANIDVNTHHFSLVTRYKNEPEKYAELLPEFERSEIVEMMDSSLSELQEVIEGKITRLDTPNVDWAKVNVDADQITYKGAPVFLADWTWKPSKKEYTEFHGNQDGFFLTPTHVVNEQGRVAPHILKQLEEKTTGSAGFVFFNHSAVPKWAVAKDPSFKDGAGIKYTMYDINNPLARTIQSNLIGSVVPLMAGNNYTKLGYMLCNEPHWNTIKGSWASTEISEYAYAGFIEWLKERHGEIATLNSVWGTSFASFDAIDTPRIMTNEQQGTPLYFDFMLYNQYRVTEWFAFLKDEIQKYDPQAKTHIKIMPNLWSEGKRDSGIDLEALTRNSEIIGNDAGSCGAWMWGAPKHWEKHYSFDWVELCMAQDFYKSVSPDKIVYNTEAHFLSTGKHRDLYQTPQYARCNYWMATIHGMTVSQSWYWCRREDGSSRESQDSNGYAGSNNHQPRIVNEVHATILDLNSVSDKIMAFQRQCKPLRIFYTKASAINDLKYMDDIFEAYEAVTFSGQPIGFATEGILENNDCEWDVIAIYKTPRAFASDVEALQKYLDQGGSIVMDDKSLLHDEYGRELKVKLHSSKGTLIVVESLDQLSSASLSVVESGKNALLLSLKQDNGGEQAGCLWRVIEGKKGAKYLNISNIGKTDATIDVAQTSGKAVKSIKNLLTGEIMPNGFVMKPYDTYLFEVL
ncbi:MAG: beta-galactosidase [Rikenellaceae bacterium]